MFFFFFSSRRRHTRYWRDWSSDVCSSDLALLIGLAERRPDVIVEAAQELVAPVQKRDPRPEPGEDAGELDRDVPRPNNENPLGQPLELENVVRGDAVLAAWDGG